MKKSTIKKKVKIPFVNTGMTCRECGQVVIELNKKYYCAGCAEEMCDDEEE